MVAAYAEGKNILHNLVRVGGYGYMYTIEQLIDSIKSGNEIAFYKSPLTQGRGLKFS